MSSSSVAAAPLEQIDFYKLCSNDLEIASAEGHRVYDAARTLGAFYLDLSSPMAENTASDDPSYLTSAGDMFNLMKRFFSLSTAEKQLYDVNTYDVDINGDYFGFKGEGTSIIDDHGTRDCTEYYNIPKDDMLDQYLGQLRHPPVILDDKAFLRQYVEQSANIVNVLLGHLSDRLGIQDPNHSLPNLHRLEAHSTSRISMVYYPARSSRVDLAPLAPHSDFGTLTLLFSSSRGIQMPVPQGNGGQWHWIEPRHGCAIVFCGDVLSMLTGGVIRANYHRVASQAERADCDDRHSIGYFSRPENNVYMEALLGKQIPILDGGVEQRKRQTVHEMVMERAYRRRNKVKELQAVE